MAVLKLSAIAAAGGSPGSGDQLVGVSSGTTDNLFTLTQVNATILNTVGMAVGSAKITGGTSGNFLFDSGGTLGERTAAQATAALNLFTSALQGLVPASGGGTTNFLRADGTFAAPSAGGLTVGTTTISGGTNNELLFDSGPGTLQETTGITAPGTGQLVTALGTITTNLKALSITGTWNAAGVTFDAPLFMNITPTASAANSALVDIQQTGVSQLMLFNRTASTASPTLVLGNSTNATQFLIYNTVDTLNNPTNYERLTLDWTTSTNVATIGMQKGGTGSSRLVSLIGQSPTNSNSTTFNVGESSGGLSGTATGFPNNGKFNALEASVAGTNDVFFQAVPGTAAGFGYLEAFGGTSGLILGTGGAANPILFKINRVEIGRFTSLASGQAVLNLNTAGSWIQWTGELRTSSGTNYTNATPTTIMSVSLLAGRTYSFDGYIPVTAGGNAGGVQVVLNASGGLTATAIQTDSIAVSNNAVVGQVSASTITTLTSVVLGATTGYVEFHGTITVNAAGTLNFQTAQNTTNATTMTIGRGARVFLQDMP